MSGAERMNPAVDVGPMARLEVVRADPGVVAEVFRLLTDGSDLKAIAKLWAVPRGEFARWFTTQHGEEYEAALKVRADELAHDAVAIADEQKEVVRADGSTFDPEVPRDKLRVDTRLRLVEKWDRMRYGAKDAGPAGGITVVVDRSCNGAVQVGVKDAGGNVAAIRIDGAEALAAGASAPVLGKMEI